MVKPTNTSYRQYQCLTSKVYWSHSLSYQFPVILELSCHESVQHNLPFLLERKLRRKLARYMGINNILREIKIYSLAEHYLFNCLPVTGNPWTTVNGMSPRSIYITRLICTASSVLLCFFQVSSRFSCRSESILANFTKKKVIWQEICLKRVTALKIFMKLWEKLTTKVMLTKRQAELNIEVSATKPPNSYKCKHITK